MKAVPLRGLTKVIRASEKRRTRFHTERGEMLPLVAVPAAVRNFVRRVRQGMVSEEPWIAPSATEAIRVMLDDSWTVLEVGPVVRRPG